MFVSKRTRIELIVLIGLMISIFVLSYLVVNNHTEMIDDLVYTSITAIYSSSIMLAAQILSALGSPSVILAFSLIILVFFKDRNRKIMIITHTGLIYFFTIAFQNFIMRPLPAHMHLIKVVGFSFPSEYVSLATIFYGTVVLYLLKGIKQKYLRTIVVFGYSILIILIGLARIYTGANYATDVIAGFGLAIMSYIIMRFILDLIRLLLQRSLIDEKNNKQETM